MAAKVIKTRPKVILVSDLDWTMVDHDDKDNSALLAFNKLWKDKFASDSLLVFSTGRSHALYTELRAKVPLLEPDVLVCSVGTEIFFEAASTAASIPDQAWCALLDEGWDRAAVVDLASKQPGLTLQGKSEQRPHKVSYRVSWKAEEAEKLALQLQGILLSNETWAKVIYSGGEDLDILPARASKGKGLEFLLGEIEEAVGLQGTEVIVNGDSGNDVELFMVPDVKGTMVSNAHPELVSWVDQNATPDIFKASKRCAAGIVEGLQHFKLA